MLKARFAAARIRIADGPARRIGDKGEQQMPGKEAWLIGEHRSTGERKYYLSNLAADASLKALAGAAKARWACDRPTSSSRRNWAWTTSKDDHGSDYTDTP